jgi:hypothetical protein
MVIIALMFCDMTCVQGAPHHYHCDSVNTLVRGAKRWFILPPAQSFYTNEHPRDWLKSHFNDSEVRVLSSKRSIDQSWSWDEFKDILSHRGLSSRLGVCDQSPGDMLYMPAHYGHSTLNLEESIGLAYEFDRGDC